MINSARPDLLVPIRAPHVLVALAEARPNQSRFRHDEMKWLQANHGYLSLHIQKIYEVAIQTRGGLDIADAILSGCALGSRAVRLCTDERQGYDQVKVNAVRNVEADSRSVHLSDAPWDTRGRLDEVFGDPDLTAALLEIRHDNARDAAAVTIGMLCLQELPPPRSFEA